MVPTPAHRLSRSVVHLQVGQHVLHLGGPQPEDLQRLELGLQRGERCGGEVDAEGGELAELCEERGALGPRQDEQLARLARVRAGSTRHASLG